VSAVSTTLLVAAGGGGDALASLIVNHALTGSQPDNVIVASFSWDRYLIDPTPGPRTTEDFDGLVPCAPRVFEVRPSSRLRTGGTSGLAILAQHTSARYFLMDPTGGAVGVRSQIAALAEHVTASAVTLVDVGGDITAQGDEPQLASPLADSLALAAMAGLPTTVQVVVAGPGLDGELPDAYVRARMAAISATHHRATSADAKAFTAALDHHPSEATALLSAAAMGVDGRAEIRDSAALVPLDAGSADLFMTDARALLATNRVAGRLTSTASFQEAESITRAVCGRTELDHERKKANTLRQTPYVRPTQDEIHDRVTKYRVRAAARGASLISFRRLAEAAGMRDYDAALIRATVGNQAYDDIPLCRL
jgi:hypothetical protein